MSTDGSLVHSEYHDEVIQVQLCCANVLEQPTIDAIGDKIKAAIGDRSSPHLVIGFDSVQHLSSAALGMLITVQTQIKAMDGALCLAGIDDRIMDVFRITGLDQIFAIESSCETAREAVRA